MAQVIVSPAELKAFARRLEDIAEQAVSRKNLASTRLDSLHASWRDQKYASFERTFEQTAIEIDRFAKMATAYAEYLDHKARIAEEYLGHW